MAKKRCDENRLGITEGGCGQRRCDKNGLGIIEGVSSSMYRVRRNAK